MAIHIPIRLVEETAEYVIYEYSQPILAPDPSRQKRQHQVGTNVAQVRIAKSSGTVERLSGEDWDRDQRCFFRVAVKLKQYQSSGVFPHVLSFSA